MADEWDELRECGIEIEAHTYEAFLLRPKQNGVAFRIDTTLIDHGYFLHGSKRSGKVTKPITWKHGEGALSELWTVIPDAELGFPMIVEKKVLRALEMMVTEYIDAFGSVPQYLPFKIKTLTEMVIGKNHEVGGKDVTAVRQALERLHKTVIRVEKNGGEMSEFRVIEQLVVSESSNSKAEDISAYHLVVFGDFFMKSMEKCEMEHKSQDYRTVAGLFPIALALYEKFELDFSRTDADFLEYDYVALCEYLGIATHSSFSTASKSYVKILILLKQMKKISKWRMDSATFKITVNRPE